MRLGASLIALSTAVLGAALSVAAPGLADGFAEVRWPTTRFTETRAVALRSDGREATLTLDRGLQEKTRRLLKGAQPAAGAAVLIDVETNAVLAMVEIGDSPKSLLFEPVAPAASVFKLVTTAALYEHSTLTPRSKICTEGGIRRIDRDHLVPARGPEAHCTRFGDALGHSRNAVYAQLATQNLLRSDLVEMADALGFNRRLPFDVNARFGSLEVPFEDLAFARTAVGFENSRLSVLGAAELALTVAHEGEVHPLHVARDDDPQSAQAEGSLPSVRRAFSERTALRLTRMMEVTVESGTARNAFSDERGRSYLGSVKVAGKTGTLQPDDAGPTASWFVGFAPSRAPQIAISVLLLNPELWHQKANQVARDLLRVYFAERGAPGVTSPL
jgi:cell division protein FtsI/penicillin-binding protein 2